MIVLRELTCPSCGAPRRVATRAVVMICGHCGSFLGLDSDPVPLEARRNEGVRRMVNPSKLEARLLSLMAEIEACKVAGDREAFLLLTEEQVLAMALVHPEHHAPLPSEPAQRAAHLRVQVKLAEIATFDAGIASHMARFGAECSRLMQGDPVAVARDMMEAARAYHRALLSHPELPPGALREGAEHHARELVRQSVMGYASLLGASALERIRTEVLGDRMVPEALAVCPKCGAPLAKGAAACGHCGAVTRVDEADAWTSAVLALWEIAKADLARSPERLDGPSPVIAAVGCFFYTRAVEVPASRAASYLRRAIPWVELRDLDAGLEILAHGASDEQRALLGGIRAATRDWVASPSARPTPPVAAPLREATAEEEEAWLESALAYVRMRPSTAPLELLAYPLGAVQVAAVHGQHTGATARAALRFFELASPKLDRAEMRREVEKLIPGYDHPRARAFLVELARLLGEP